jgi:short-subunit dehydrogenase
MDNNNSKKPVVLITGATSGIGKALAFHFGKNGYAVAFTARNSENIRAVSNELQNSGITAFGIAADVSKEEDCKKMTELTLEKFGRIDVLINNAGISMRALFEDLDLEVIRQVMDINFFGAVYATKYALPEIIKNKGTIVGISSIAGYRGLAGRTGYSASKFALQGFLETIRCELMPYGVNVLTVAPGFTASNIRKTALAADGSAQGESPRDEQKMMSAEECAEHIFKAVKKRRKILTLTAQGKLTVFLNKFFPVFMDKMVFNAMAKEPDSPLKKFI